MIEFLIFDYFDFCTLLISFNSETTDLVTQVLHKWY